MKNRIASLFLVFALLMSLCNFAVARDNRITVQSGGAERFTDVPTDHWAYGYINTVVGSGLFNGKTPTTFEPSNAMTRSQFVMVMARMEGMSSLEGQYTVTKFPDVTPTRRAAGPIAWASADEQGFVRGFGDGTFKPDSPITRGQFAALIHRYIIAKRYTNLHVVDPIPAQFTDADSVSSAFTEDVEYARIHGLLTGYSDGTVRASNPITRAAIAAILARFLDLVTESGYTPLLDGPIGGGDNGDSDEPPVEVPTSYDGMRLNITNAKRGTTSFVSVLRDGVQVASDDLKPGDVVTLSHVPNDGYRAKITVKDSKGRKVDVNTNGNVSTFTVPENMPVTITLKYLAQGSGSSSSGSSSSSSGSTGGPIVPAATPYYLTVNATAGEGGRVYLSQTIPQAGAEIPTDANVIGSTAQQTFTRNNTNGITTVIGYAVFVPDAGHTFQGATTDTPNTTTLTPTGPDYSLYGVVMKRGGADVTVTYVMVTAAGAPSGSVTPSVNVSGTFTGGESTGSGDEPGPGPVTERHWTVNVTNNDEFVYFALSTTDPTAPTAENPTTPTTPAALTANGPASVNPLVTDGTEKKVYLTLTPRAGFKFDASALELTPAADTTVTQIWPASNSNETDTVRVYEISRSAFTATTTTTNVSINMQLASGVGFTHAVTLNSFVLGKPDEPLPTDDVPLEVSVVKEATYLDPVTVNVPLLPGYGGYDLNSITVVGADNTPVTCTKDNANSSATRAVYTFIMPNQPVTVTVIYKPNDNPELTFDVAVSVEGQGAVSLNIAGVTQTIDTADVTSFPVHRYVRLSDSVANGGTVIVTDDKTAGQPMRKSDYVELYGNENFTLPVYLTATPVPGQNYRFTSASYNGRTVSADNISAGQTVGDGTANALNVSVTFSPITSYGYNLTVIGQGTVSVDSNTSGSVFHTSAPYRNTSGLPETYSSGLIVDAPSSLTLNVTPTVNTHEVSIFVLKTNADGTSTTTDYSNGASIPLNQNALTDIVVDIQDPERGAVEFSVEVTGGPVEVKSEGGYILPFSGNGYTPETAKEELTKQDSRARKDKDPITSTTAPVTRRYFALENSVITITPTSTDTSVKVTELTVRRGLAKENNQNYLSDVLSTKGFSFQLPSDGANATVTYGAFDSYSVLFQAPYNGGKTDDIGMRSLSTNITKGTYLNANVRDVLYSLNNGNRFEVTDTRTGITNIFQAPDTINRALVYYFSHEVVRDEEDHVSRQGYITGADSVKKMLETSIGATIENVFPSVVEAKKAELKADPTNVNGPIADAMTTLQSNRDQADATPIEVTGATKSKILEGTSYRDQIANGTYQESQFQIWANVTTIVSKAKETQLKAAYPALDLDGKSAETQLSRFVSDYLGKIRVDPNYNYSDLTPEVTVTPNAQNAEIPTLAISARVTAGNNNWPHLDPTISMTDYADRLNIWIVAQVSQILFDSNNDGTFEQNVTQAVAPELYNAAQLGVTLDMTGRLRDIDTAVRNNWDSNFTASGVQIDMTQVLSGQIIGDIVKDAIEGPSNTLTDKIGSLGNGENTRTAFMNLYDGFVNCDPKDPAGNILTLKTKSDTPTVIGKISGTNNETLQLTLDFTKILKDANIPASASSYEMPNESSYEVLVDLLIGLRNGISTDIRETAEKNNTKQSAQSVVASLIEGQLNGSNRNAVRVNKWGKTKLGSEMTAAERKEISNLLAGLVMNSKMDDTFNSAWQRFEESGYQSVAFTFMLDANKRASLAPILESVADALGTDPTKLEIGFNVTQVIN